MADRTSAASELEATLGWFVKDRRLAGAAAGVVCGDGATWSGGAGYADLASGTLATPATLYRVASITKTFTGMAVMQLRDAGLLDLDEPAITYLPEMRDSAQPDARLELVTLRRMLAHASGLASEPPGTDWTVPLYQGVVTRTLGHPGAIATRVPVGQHPKYSNLAYQLLGEVVARVAGIPYVEYMQEKVLLPLEMDATSFDPAIGFPQQFPATGYAPRAFSDELEVASVMPPLWAEGGLWSCVDDLIKWVSVQLGAHRGNAPNPAILSGISLREMHAPRYLDGNDWTQAWGLAWCAVRRDDAVWIQHSGALPGFSTAVCFDPEGQVGGVVLINGSADASGVAMDLAGVVLRAARTRPPRIGLPQPTPDHFRPLLGLYSRGGYSHVIRLEWRDGRLVFIDPEEPRWRPALMATNDPYVFTVEPGYRESGEPVTFNRLPDGRIDSVFLAAGTWRRLEHVEQLD